MMQVMWTSPKATVEGDDELVRLIDDALVVAITDGTLDALLASWPSELRAVKIETTDSIIIEAMYGGHDDD